MIIIKTTSNSHKAMKDITNTLLNNRYAACVNIIPRMRSKYVLDGRIVESREVMLLIKTSEAFEDKVYKTIIELHNYKTPEISSIETKKVDKDYAEWLESALK